MYNLLAMDQAKIAPWMLQAGSLVTVLFCAVLLWAALGIVYDRFPRPVAADNRAGKAADSVKAHTARA